MYVEQNARQSTRLAALIRLWLVLSLAAILLWVISAAANRSLHYWFLLWNLLLAWLPLIFASWLLRTVQPRKGWRHWQSKALLGLWLIFLPNAFYLITDYMHLQDVPRVDAMLDIVMFTMFVIAGLAVGYTSLFMVHRALKPKLIRPQQITAITALFVLCGFALYLGRQMRWNSWDIITDPFGLIFNVSDVIIHPGAHPQAFTMTLLFASFFGLLYGVIVRASKLLR